MIIKVNEMVNSEVIFGAIFLLLMSSYEKGSNAAATNLNNMNLSSTKAENLTTRDEKVELTNMELSILSVFPNNNTQFLPVSGSGIIIPREKQMKAEIREYYRHVYAMNKVRRNTSILENPSSLEALNEYGKPFSKAVCQDMWKLPYENFQSNLLHDLESWSCLVPRLFDYPVLKPSIKIVDNTELREEILRTDTGIKNHSEPGNCTVVIFYARWCNLSAKAAPHFNAIPRAFGNIRFVAVDTFEFPQVVPTFVIYAVPTILLFHNGRIHARFTNESYDASSIAEFLENHTDQTSEFVTILPSDYDGPIPTVAIRRFHGEEVTLAWIFILFSFVYGLFTQPAFNLFLKIYLNIQSVLDDVEFSDSKFKESKE